jgi:hypothetical protein
LNETRFDPKKVVPDISQPKKYGHYFDALDEKITFITHGFRVSVVSDVQKRVLGLVSPLRFIKFMLRRSSLVECVSVLHGTCLQCAEKKNIHQYVKIEEDLNL